MRNDWQILIPRKTKWLRLIIKSGRSDFLNYQKVFPVQYTENLYLDYIVRAVNLLQGYFFSFRVQYRYFLTLSMKNRRIELLCKHKRYSCN